MNKNRITPIRSISRFIPGSALALLIALGASPLTAADNRDPYAPFAGEPAQGAASSVTSSADTGGWLDWLLRPDSEYTQAGKTGEDLERATEELEKDASNREKLVQTVQLNEQVQTECMSAMRDPDSLKNAKLLRGQCRSYVVNACKSVQTEEEGKAGCDLIATDEAVSELDKKNGTPTPSGYTCVRAQYVIRPKSLVQSVEAQAKMREADKRMAVLQNTARNKVAADTFGVTVEQYVASEFQAIKNLRKEAADLNKLTEKTVVQVQQELPSCAKVSTEVAKATRTIDLEEEEAPAVNPNANAAK